MSGPARLRAERLLALALLVVVVSAVGFATFGTAYAAFSRERSKAQAAISLVQRYEAIIGRQERYARQLATTDADAAFENVFLDVPSRASGAARLQEMVNAVAASSSVTVNRLSLVRDRRDSGISVAVQITGDLVTVSTFMVALEAHEPWLFVEAMRLTHPRASRARQLDRSNPALAGIFTITAYTEPGGEQ